ncbi:MAG TPA: NAD(P)H-binding protein [Actinocatenispora sp.]
MTSFLILGGTGKVGRRVARRLTDDGRSVRAASRTGAGVRVDLADPAGWAPALAGVTAAYLLEPDLRAGADGRLGAFVAAAAEAGVRRLVLLSAPGATDPRHPLHAVERAVRDAGVGWTILRPTWFAQNFSEGPWLPGVLAGTVALPTGDGRTPFVDAEDIAEVAASALTDDRHHGQVYELTGPHALSVAAATALIARATGRTVRHLDVTPEEYVARQAAAGVPVDVARLLAGALTGVREGRGAALADGVVRALGRPPHSFADFVTASTPAWS